MKDLAGVTNVSYDSHGDDIVGIEKIQPKEPKQPKDKSHTEGSPPEEVLATKVLTDDEKNEGRRIMRNILIISFAFFFLFTSYNGMTNLQSSLNKASGTAALTALYIAFIISSCFTPSWVLKVLQEKKALIISMLMYSVYMMAQFYPTIYTLLPTAIVLGVAAAPLWSAKCTYLSKVSDLYGEIHGEKSYVVYSRFFGIFFLVFQSTQIVGNLISSLVLSVGVEFKNESIDEEAISKCGFYFCIAETSPEANTNVTSDALETGPLWQIYTMAGIYLACALASALVIAIFLDPLSRFTSDSSEESESSLKLLVATFNHMRHPYQLLIIPLTIWSGIEQAFLSTDFTAAYVSCAIGVHMVGYIMICYGVCDAICSYGFSYVVKKWGRVPVFTLAFLINLAIMITLMYWKPHPDEIVWFFVIAGLWGVADAVWQTQINSLYGVIFPGESAAGFSNYRLWESLGFFIAYVCSTVLCINEKITILFVLLIPGMTFYYVIEILEKRGTLRRNENEKVPTIDQLFKGRTH
ncbi:LOW QUALITY PROTEIN: protein unc-93 homolog A-like [Macrobrachium rosenbergii]|uniref:LOW QUALITY PROTEIN: protein unc-93 homolog A-like n=1 Tax=Macrobrachium rosenbergii TaxID=79674 RepID=UPI0034D4C7A6